VVAIRMFPIGVVWNAAGGPFMHSNDLTNQVFDTLRQFYLLAIVNTIK
jgi:hypothetical protein